MSISLKVLTSIATTNSAVNWANQAQQTTVLYNARKQFLRNVVLSTDGVSVRRGSNVVGINIATLVVACASVDSALTYPPVVTADPVAASVTHPAAASFGPVAATSELSVTYQWQKSTTSGGTTYANLTNAGVYTNVTTSTVNISDSTGLNGYLFRCTITNAAGSTNTASVALTVA